MMTGLMDKRKRSREDDYCESTPLSKRINNLHINNNNLDEAFHHHHHHNHQQQQQHQDYSTSNMGLQNMQQQQQQHINHSMNNYQNILHHNHSANANQVPQDDFHHQYSYDPELNEHDNPIYYNKNKLLHELHFERVKRNQI